MRELIRQKIVDSLTAPVPTFTRRDVRLPQVPRKALVHPFSFREYLRHSGREPHVEPERLPKAARSTLARDLEEYLVTGGFPEALGVPVRDRFELLRGFVDLALLRDVIERHAVSHPVALRWLARHLLGNAAGTFSVHKFWN